MWSVLQPEPMLMSVSRVANGDHSDQSGLHVWVHSPTAAGSVLMSVAHIFTEGHVDVHGNKYFKWVYDMQ